MHADDLSAMEVVLEQTGLFPAQMLRAMAEPYLLKQAEHQWLVAVKQQRTIGFAYVEPERMTEGTFNLLAIAVEPEAQGGGVGRTMVSDLMQRLSAQGGRVLLVETSSLDEFAATRAFYEKQDFSQEARIRDFYQNGEDKLIYWKSL